MSNEIKIVPGEKREFATGAKRQASAGKGTPILVPGDAVLDIAKLFEKGAEVYSPRNWEKGLPLSSILDSLERHLQEEKMGQTDENHARALAWNAMIYLATKLRIAEGILPDSLNDMPDYESVKNVAVIEESINKSLEGWFKICTEDNCEDEATLYCDVRKKSLCDIHYHSNFPFKKGDKVKIKLRSSAALSLQNLCKDFGNRGIYDVKNADGHDIKINSTVYYFYDNEIILLENN